VGMNRETETRKERWRASLEGLQMLLSLGCAAFMLEIPYEVLLKAQRSGEMGAWLSVGCLLHTTFAGGIVSCLVDLL